MKNTRVQLLLWVGLCALSLQAWGQAKKPTIMVVPSDVYCISRGYSMSFDNQGSTVILPDYKAALQQDNDLRLVIAKLGEMMVERGFPLKDLETEMKNIANRAAEQNGTSSGSGSGIAESPLDVLRRTANADIIMDLDFTVKSQGPRRYITFVLKGLDAYTSEQVAGASGSGEPSLNATPEGLMQEAVLSYIDNFNNQLQDHFNDLFENGRKVTIQIQRFDSCPVDLYEEYSLNGEEIELGDFIDDWISGHAVQGRYNHSGSSENYILFTEVRIPLFNEENRAVDTRLFLRDLRRALGNPPFDLDSRIDVKGLGEARLIIGAK